MGLSKNELLLVNRISVLEYYNKYIVPLNKKFLQMSESRVTSLCPFHKDTDPSFHYWKKKNIFHCFGCGVGGNVVRLHQLVRQTYYNENVDKQKAIETLAILWGIKLEDVSHEKVLNVFESARKSLTDLSVYNKPSGEMTLAKFYKLNKKVIDSSISVESKVFNFGELDMLMASHVAKYKN